MKRRTALKHLGLGVSAGLILPSWLSSCKDEPVGPEIDYAGTVAIIGAGASGLYAADILRAKGIKVLLYEASDRVGGRVRSLRMFDKPTTSLLFDPENKPASDYPTELGAERVWGTDGAWGTIIAQQQVPSVTLPSSPNAYIIDGAIMSQATADTDQDVANARAFVAGLVNYSGSNISVAQAIQNEGLSERVAGILNSWIGNRYGTTNDKLSVSALAEDLKLITRNKTELTLKSNPMQDALTSRFAAVASQAILNAVVKSINYASAKVTISGTQNGEPFSAEVDKVIVTVPISVLKASNITFNPALPSAKTTALSRMDMDAAIRVCLDFKQNFWGNDVVNIYGGSTTPEYFSAGVGRGSSQNTLSLTFHGAKAEALSAKGKGMITDILAELDAVYNKKATQNIRRDANDNMITVIQDWSKEAYILGSSSYIKPGGTHDDRVNLSKPISNRLFFAGEATDISGEAGNLNGALLAGARAAQEVITSIVG